MSLCNGLFQFGSLIAKDLKHDEMRAIRAAIFAVRIVYKFPNVISDARQTINVVLSGHQIGAHTKSARTSDNVNPPCFML